MTLVVSHIAAVLLANAMLGAGEEGFGASRLLLLAGGVLGLGIVLRSTFRRVARSRTPPSTSARGVYAELTENTEARHDVERVMLELDQLARQIHGRIDTRCAKLEAIIRDADDRIDRLSRLVRDLKGEPRLDITVGDGPSPRPSSKRETSSQSTTPGRDDPEVRHAAVYRLADAGLSPQRIADKTGQTAGEVEFILALRRTKRASTGPSGLLSSAPPTPSS
ncbi:MAG: hypothetical protein ACE5HE_05015 [Phycisphaerae bacterium]